MKKTMWILLGGLCLQPQIGWTIGRAGNGTTVVDVGLGFEAQTPNWLLETEAFDDQSLRISVPTFIDGFMAEDYLHFVPLNAFFPELNPLDRKDSNQWKISSGGKQLRMQNPCVDAHLYESSSLVYGTAQWGRSKGVAVFAPLTAEGKQNILLVLSTLKLKAGACEWK